MVAHVLLMSAEYACGLHCAASLGTEDALDHDSSPHVKGPTVVANPIIVRNFVDTIASLVHRDVASSTKDNEIFILVISVVTDSTLSVLLDNQATLVRTERIVSLDVEAVGSLAVRVVGTLRQLLQNALVIQIIFLLLPLLDVAQEFFFLFRWIAYIK